MRNKNTQESGVWVKRALRCLRCGYEWCSRKKKPKSCPACKAYQWDTKKSE